MDEGLADFGWAFVFYEHHKRKGDLS